MNKLKNKLPIIIILLVAGVAVFWFLGKDKLKIKAEEIPFGLEWGMTEEEFLAVMEDTECIPKKINEARNLFIYQAYDFLDVEGANATIVLMTDEHGKLSDVSYLFYSSRHDSSDPVTSKELLDSLQEAFQKSYKKKSKEVLIDSDPLQEYSCFYILDDSLVNIWTEEDRLVVEFDNINRGVSQAIIESLRSQK